MTDGSEKESSCAMLSLTSEQKSRPSDDWSFLLLIRERELLSNSWASSGKFWTNSRKFEASASQADKETQREAKSHGSMILKRESRKNVQTECGSSIVVCDVKPRW